jgi:WD40 repeat protein
VITYDAHYRHANDVTYSQEDPALIASVGFDGFVRLWDIRLKPSTDCVLVSNLGQIGSSVAFETAAERTILAGTDAGEIVSVDYRQGSSATGAVGGGVLHKEQLFRSRVRRIRSHSARKGLFVACSDDTTFAVFHHVASTEFHLKTRVQTHEDYVADVAWVPNASPEGQYDLFYSASTDKTVRSTQINVYSP